MSDMTRTRWICALLIAFAVIACMDAAAEGRAQGQCEVTCWSIGEAVTLLDPCTCAAAGPVLIPDPPP